MEEFIKLILFLDSTTSTNEKVKGIAQYFSKADPADSAWMLFFLSGHRFKRLVSSQKLLEWCLQETKIPDWLFTESYAQVGDVAETISLLLQGDGSEKNEDFSFDGWMKKYILPLRNMPEEEQRVVIISEWKKQSFIQRFVMNKILTGSFRIGVSHLLTLKGLSKAHEIPTSTLNVRLAGSWEPTEDFFLKLISNEENDISSSLNSYPFFLASPFEGDLNELGPPQQWAAEWKWDGIRAQMIFRNGDSAIWSRGKDLITHMFPELLPDQSFKDSFVFDGEILAFQNERPLPFVDLQKRLGRKNPSRDIQSKYPVAFMIYDLLEINSKDQRFSSFEYRRKKIEELIPKRIEHPLWRISPLLKFEKWDDVLILRQQAENNLTEGVMLKKKDSKYGIGRQRGSWWKYKIDSMTVDAVLMYAQPGTGYRSGLYTDYTFAVWDQGNLVPIAKAYSGLTQKEISELDFWIRKHTIEKFGPVRHVEPFQVFEIAFENIQISKRHKSGLALRFPRIKRWRVDKTAEMADDLDSLRDLLKKRTQISS